MPLAADWRLVVTAPQAALAPGELSPKFGWLKATVPGTALGSLRDQSPSGVFEPVPLHDHDVWYTTALQAHAGERLRFLGLAGLAEIWIDDRCALRSTSMFVAHTLTVPRDGRVALSICFRSLGAALRANAGRARWRTRLVDAPGLQRQRQTLLGHMPGWCPSWHAVGPYRAIERIRGAGTVEAHRLSTAMRGADGMLSVQVQFAEALDRSARLAIRVGERAAPLAPDPQGAWTGELLLPEVRTWWPHTHGAPTLHEVFLVGGTAELLLGRVGFRAARVTHGADGDGFGIEINGVAIFCRGACWTNADLLGLADDRETYAGWLRLAREAGMNMIRVGGTMLYESRSFHELCDEMGILVWQDLMFANLDYATDQTDFRNSAAREVEQLVERLAGSPSLVVLCGGSEMAQQATMLGLGPERRRMEFFEAFLPELVRRLDPDLHYVAHSPWGGALPIAVNAGVSHYYGVGAYRRGLDDARRASVRFASECLGLANPPSATSPAVAGIESGPRDRGASWTFADVRDHYLRELYEVDPASLRGEDPARYYDLSRAVSADLMEAVFAEWRRPGSSCAGGLVWQLQDLAPCSGWGIIDSHAHPKAAWHGLRRVLAPMQILLSDEGLDGLGLHVVNETVDRLEAVVRIACLRRGGAAVAAAERAVTINPRGSVSLSSQTLLDGFFDITRAYRFGPAEHSVTVASLHCAASDQILSEAFHFPVGRRLPLDDLGLAAALGHAGGGWFLDITASRFAQAVHLEVEGYRASRDWFHLPPASTRRVALLPNPGVSHPPSGVVAALNGAQAARLRADP